MRKIFICLPSSMLFAMSVQAQKLPNKQSKSIWAPANIKIDGTTAEWKDGFQAYNKATDIFYTVSNDDKNLYLTAQATYKEVINKIIRGGISFTVGAGKKDKNAVTITYPFMEGSDMFPAANRFISKFEAYKESKKADADVADVKAVNEVYGTNEKMMKVAGLNNVTEPTISVYNDIGIKAVGHFDNKLAYTCELSIPLSFLKTTDKGVFNYHIKINDPPPMQRPAVITANTPPPPPPTLDTDMATTDFWGEYTLAKK